MDDRRLTWHLIAIVAIKMAVLMGIWILFFKPYRVEHSIPEISRAVLGSQSQEGAARAQH